MHWQRSPAICTLEMPSGTEKRKIPHPAGPWENGATSSSCQHCPVSSPSSRHRSRPAFHHPLPPCALSQRDELTSSISEFLRRSPTPSLNFTKPCQRPWSKMQKQECFLKQKMEIQSAAAGSASFAEIMQPQHAQCFPLIPFSLKKK